MLIENSQVWGGGGGGVAHSLYIQTAEAERAISLNPCKDVSK